MQQQTFVAHRIICNYVSSVGDVLNVPITNELLVSAATARSKYDMFLETEREARLTAEQQRKRKSTLEKIDSIKKTKKTQAEVDTTGNMQFVSEANALRRKAKT